MHSWELEVRESVRQTLADYTAATDRFDLHALAGCFAERGVLEFHGGDVPLTGPAEIEAGLGAAMKGDRDPNLPSATHVRHHVSSVRFGSVSRDRVEVSSYFAVHTDVGLDHWGRYIDEFDVVDGEWLITKRVVTTDGVDPEGWAAALS